MSYHRYHYFIAIIFTVFIRNSCYCHSIIIITKIIVIVIISAIQFVQTFIDIDECQGDTDPCPSESRCKNQNPGYTCVCEVGYSYDENTGLCEGTVTPLFTACDSSIAGDL